MTPKQLRELQGVALSCPTTIPTLLLVANLVLNRKMRATELGQLGLWTPAYLPVMQRHLLTEYPSLLTDDLPSQPALDLPSPDRT